MATIAQNQDDEQNKNNAGPTPITGTGGAGQPSGNAAGAASPVAQNVAPQNTGSFNDVSGYLNANQPGANQLAGQVSSNLSNLYNSTKQGINDSAQGTQQQVTQGYTPSNTDLIHQVAANPTSAASDPNLVSQFQAQLNDKYTGPTNWADYGTQQGKVAQAQQQGSLYKTAGGNNVLAQQVERANNQGYSGGVNALDALLLGSPTAATQVQAASQPYDSLGSYLDSQNQGIQDAVQTGQNSAATASSAAQNAFLGPQGVATQFNTGLQSQLTAAQQKAAADNAALYQAITSQTKGQKASDIGLGAQANRADGNQQWVPYDSVYLGGSGAVGATGTGAPTLSADQLAALGITPQQYQQLQQQAYQAMNPVEESAYKNQRAASTQAADVPLQNYLSQLDPMQALNLNNTANAGQLDEANALSTLLGSGNYTNPINGPLTSAPQLNSFDFNQALNDLMGYNQSQQQSAKQAADNQQVGADAQHDAQKGGLLKKVTNSLPFKYLENPLQTVPQQFQEAKKRI